MLVRITNAFIDFYWRLFFPDVLKLKSEQKQSLLWNASALEPSNTKTNVVVTVAIAALLVGLWKWLMPDSPRSPIWWKFSKFVLFSFYAAFGALMILLVHFLTARKAVNRRVREELNKLGYRLCVPCGYDLRGQVTTQCPECGWDFSDDSSISTWPRPDLPPPSNQLPPEHANRETT